MPTFLNSHSFTVSGGVFTDVVVQNNGSGLQSLYNSAALGASYDSSERYPPPKCHPQTRQHILRIIMEWVGNRNRARHILWLNGPAGAGKSSIAQTVAETCAERRQLAGGFFFSRNTPGRNDASRLVNTLAYQIAISVPRLKEIIGQVIQEDPSVLSKSLGSQFRALIVDPLKKWALPCDPPASDEDSEEPIPPQLVIVDGLDECADDRIQQDIIALISESAATHHLPLCFLIASRPEPHIRDAFMRSVPQDILQRITLDKSFLPDRDIRIFLQTGFADIYEKHWELMKSVPLPWPSDEVLTHLVSTASGQFIYASTVLKFVDNKFTRPTRQLAVVLDKSCPRPTAFEAMDQLYSSIVSTNPDTESVLRILGAVLILTDQASISVIEGLLGLEAGDVALTLNGLHSLLHVPQRSSQCITFYHASLPDFLLDATRSRNFYIDAAFHHSCISRSCIRMVKSWSNSLAPESR
ncbi:hypothetical protein FB451DRAFT_1051340 [Mycena latifolia]|nr:hypothetical protein FB451DRAFT_1051340 [Mycena latifolia]